MNLTIENISVRQQMILTLSELDVVVAPANESLTLRDVFLVDNDTSHVVGERFRIEAIGHAVLFDNVLLDWHDKAVGSVSAKSLLLLRSTLVRSCSFGRCCFAKVSFSMISSLVLSALICMLNCAICWRCASRCSLTPCSNFGPLSC